MKNETLFNITRFRKNILPIFMFLGVIVSSNAAPAPLVEYRMDECHWLDNSGGVTGDVKDSSTNGDDATSYNTATVSAGQINNAGSFTGNQDHVEVEDQNVGNNSNRRLSVSFWVNLDNEMGTYAAVLVKTRSWDWDDGWGFVNPDAGSSNRFRFFVNSWGWRSAVTTTLQDTEGWVHFVGTYDGTRIRLYKNGIEEGNRNIGSRSIESNTPIHMGWDLDTRTAELEGKLDEVKVWDSVLSLADIEEIFENESLGLNYDGTPREPVTCEATAEANSWTMVGIPIDLRTDPKTVAQTFQGMNGIYGTDWRVYRRDYSDANNSSWYTYLDDPDTNMTEFGKGYLLGNKQSEQNWNVNGTQAVDYNSAQAGCPANQCVEIDVKSVSLDAEATPPDDLLGTGPYRYNMTGFTGKSPVSWADCRFIINGTVYTPEAAESAGYASKVIWQYNPGNSEANANGYTSCDDTTPGTCLLEPYKGFWVELHGPTKNLPVKLLIPKE